jgi:LysR family nitrogen assimilation transcriptional regulator
MPVDLRQLRYFLAIGDSGALSYAAQSLNVAQSALSHHLQELETNFGVPLVTRHPRGVTLTPAGRRLYEHARTIMAAVARAESDVQAFAERATGPVSVGLPHTVTMRVALPLIRAIKQEFPDVMMGLVEAMSHPLVERLVQNQLDIAVVYNAPDDARLSSIPILEESLYLIGTPQFLKDLPNEVTFDNVLKLPLIMPHPDSTTASLVESYYLRNQLPARVMEFDSLFAISHALAEGIGCSILAKSTVTEILGSGQVIAKRIVEPEVTRTLFLARNRDLARTRASSEICNLIMRVIGEEVRAGRWEARWLEPTVSAI